MVVERCVGKKSLARLMQSKPPMANRRRSGRGRIWKRSSTASERPTEGTMSEPTYEHRKATARKTAISAERAFLYRCKTLGIDPDSVSGSPLLVIADRQM